MKYAECLNSSDRKALKGYTVPQRAAYCAYKYAILQEDRYLGSVFVNPIGQRDIEAKTRAAVDTCERLGIGHLC